MDDTTKKLQKMVKAKKIPVVITKRGTGKYERKSGESTSIESYITFSSDE